MNFAIYGRKKYGKTEYCLNVVDECIKNKKKCYFIVPEQFSLACEKRITQKSGNCANLYVEVLSFTRLCDRVFKTCGKGYSSHVSKVGKILCMSRVLSTYKENLHQYSKNASDVSFAAEAVKASEEFSAYNISNSKIDHVINDVRTKDSALADKLCDLSLLTAAYRNELKASYGTDGEIFDALIKILNTTDYFRGATVVLDSFYGYTPQELGIIRGIMRSCDDFYITFSCDKSVKNSDYNPIYQRPREAVFDIMKIAQSLSLEFTEIELDAPSYDSDINVIERNFSEKSHLANFVKEKNSGGDNVSIIKCRNSVDEAKAVSAMIYSLVSQKDTTVRYSDIAVCARNLESYNGIIDVYLEKSGIPFSYSRPEELLTQPLISYIITAIDFVSNWKMKDFLALIKTALVPVSSNDISFIESYVRTWDINGKKEFINDWFMNPSGYVEGFSEDDSLKLERINNLKKKIFEPILIFCEAVSSASDCTDIAKAVYSLITSTNYLEKMSCSDDARFWNLTVSALDEIVKVYGSDKMKLTYFSNLFSSVISEYSIRNIPTVNDAVLIGSVDLMRTETVKYMFVLGCNNEYFPMQKTENEIFSDKEKYILKENGITLSNPVIDCVYDEFFLAYNVFCEPTDKLFVLYSESDLDGKALRKSVLCDTLSNMFEKNLETSYPFENMVENITTANALYEDMYIGSHEFTSAAHNVLSETFGSEKLYFDDFSYKNIGKLSDESCEKYYGSVIRTSPSRFETYTRCRFSYFAQHLLSLQPEKRAELDRAGTGLISHKILEIFLKELAQSKVDGSIYTYEKAETRIRELLEAHFYEITHSDKNKDDAVSKRFRYLYNRLVTVLCEIAKNLVDELSQSEFLPRDYEIPIGFEKEAVKTVPIQVKNKDGEIVAELCVVGQVDRLDSYESDGKTFVRIIDYKTGGKVFNEKDVDYGFNMQMLLYLYCIAYSETKKYGSDIVPAGVLYIPVMRPEIDSTLSDNTSDVAKEAIKTAFKGSGVLIDDINVLYAMEKELKGRYIPAVIKKDGTLDSRSKTKSCDELNGLLKKASEVSSKLASYMLSGDIRKNPYKNVLSSCEYCSYKALCRIDRKDNNIRYTLEEVL